MYYWRLPVELTPIDRTLDIVSRAHRRRRSAFLTLSRASSLDGNKDAPVDHISLRFSNGDPLLDPPESLSRRNSDFYKIPEAFNSAVRLLMYAYVFGFA